MLSLESYDGVKDSLNHLEFFKTFMHLQGISNEIMCRAFPTILKGSMQVWFNKIKPNLISTFKEFSNSFVTHFIGGKRHKRLTHALLWIRQREDECLRSYVARLNKKAFLVDEADKMVIVTAFSSRLKEGEFLFSVLKNELKTIANMLFKVTKYMNTEDALIARKDGKGKRKRENIKDARFDARKKTSQFDGRKNDRRMRPPSR